MRHFLASSSVVTLRCSPRCGSLRNSRYASIFSETWIVSATVHPARFDQLKHARSKPRTLSATARRCSRAP